MLKTIHLRNFRQFEDRAFSFEDGSTAVRGPNEGGKSTILEAMFFVMGGVKFCRNNDYVTWGAKPASCKVEAVFDFNGKEYTATRSPRGAEIYEAGSETPLITGATEVTAFFEKQLGQPMAMAYRMMFAQQGDIRGLLDQAPADAMRAIEDLAGLDVVDWFIGRIQADGKTGNTTGIATSLQTAVGKLETMQEQNYDGAIASAQKWLDEANAKLEAVSQNVATAQQGVDNASATAREIQRHHDQVANAERAVANTRAALQVAEAEGTELPPEVTAGQVEEAQAAVDVLYELQREQRAFAVYSKYVAPEVEWEGNAASLDAFEKDETAKRNDAVQAGNKAKVEIAGLQGRKITETVCGLCGKDVSNIPEVQTKNAASDAAIAKQQELIKHYAAVTQEHVDNLEAVTAIRRSPSPLAGIHTDFVDRVELDHNYVPPRAKWVGTTDFAALEDLPRKQEEVDSLARGRKAFLAAQQAVTARASKIDTLKGQLDKQDTELVALKAKTLPSAPDLAALTAGLNELRTTERDAQQNVANYRAQLTSLQDAAERVKTERTQAEQDVERWQTELAEWDFNNQLIADLRAARPVVANKLWNLVLKAVSSYTTTMRGEPSEVTKVDKMFVLNGSPYNSFSGSAIDVLGLAIRVALVKVFLPHADMLVLDEPFSACDGKRQRECLAFVRSLGFRQVLVITHEDETEQVSDNLLEL